MAYLAKAWQLYYNTIQDMNYVSFLFLYSKEVGKKRNVQNNYDNYAPISMKYLYYLLKIITNIYG